MKLAMLSALLLLASVAHADTVTLESLTNSGNNYDATFSNGDSLVFTAEAPISTLFWAWGPSSFYTMAVGQTEILASYENLGCSEPGCVGPMFGPAAGLNDAYSTWGAITDEALGSKEVQIATPEPSVFLMLLVGLMALAAYDASAKWIKITNPSYTQAEGRHELFEWRVSPSSSPSSLPNRPPSFR